MRTFSQLLALTGLALCLAACTDDVDPGNDGTGGAARPYHAHTLQLGENDNPEVVQLIPETNLAIVVSSKSRELTLLQVDGDTLREVRSRALFVEDASDSELTHIAIAPDGTWAAVTRTIIEREGDERVVSCGGELVLVRVTDDERFGDELARVAVGPMPDAVAIAADGRTLAVANERDVIWGKCEGVEDLAPPSVSILRLSAGPESISEVKRVHMLGSPEREPEHLAFAASSELLAVTLQDAHEVAFLSLADLLAKDAPTDDDLLIRTLPPNAVGQDPWPDGIVRFQDGDGREYFAAAGEANDTLTVLDTEGTIVSEVEITSADIPADFPRDGTWGPLFRPDAGAAFERGGRSYLAFSLKASGALGIWDVTDLADVRMLAAVKLGAPNEAPADGESTLGTEGVAASADGYLLTANEANGTVSLVRFE